MMSKGEMLKRILAIAIVGAQVVYGISIDEGASECFEELSITNETSLVVRTSLYGDYLFSKVSMGGCRSVEAGSVFLLGLGDTLHFHPPGIWRDSRLTFMQPSEDEMVALPPEFRNENKLILLRWGNNDYFIAPSLQKACSTNDNSVSYFKFPYRSIWRSREEYYCWTAGREFRSRRAVVEERARRERIFGEDFRRRLTAAPQNPEIISALQGTVATNIQIAVVGDLTNGIPPQVQQVQVRIVGTASNRYIRGIRFEYNANGRNIYRYCYDSDGRLRWFNSERAVPGDDGRTELADPWIFEYDAAGVLLRSFDAGPNPLLVITDRTFYFSGENARIRQFLDDALEATRDIL